MTPAESLERERKKRSALRKTTTKLLTKLDKELQNHEVDVNLVEEILAQLTEKEKALAILNSTIEELIDDMDQLELEITTKEEYHERIISRKTRAARLFRGAGSESEVTAMSTSKVTVKLPHLTINTFYGDACHWLTFWEQYKAAIHENKSLSDVDKFNYFKSYLGGAALATISGLSLTQRNYDKAITMVKERFGRKEITVGAHMNKLLSLNPVKKSSDLPALRKLYDDCEVQIRSLETVGMTCDSYGSLLCPILFKIIPDEMALEFNRGRKVGEDLNVTELLAFIRNEIESRERTMLFTKKDDANAKTEGASSLYSDKHKQISGKFNAVKPKGTGTASAAALSNVSEEACIFCTKRDHATDECRSHSFAEKKEILKNNGRCFICFKKKHLARYCRVKVVCPVCQKRHRKALCEKEHAQNKPDTVVASVLPKQNKTETAGDTILLQTVRAKVIGQQAQTNIRCLLDGGSQRTFIQEAVSKKLQLTVVGEETMQLHTFGKETAEKIKCRRVKVTLCDPMTEMNRIEIEAMEIPEICTALIRVPGKGFQAKAKEHNIRLSDQTDSNETDQISLLIGSDYYWQIVTGKVTKLTDALVLVETLFGWSLQGPTSSASIVQNVSVGVLKAVVTTAEESGDQLASIEMKRFWDLETMGIKDEPEGKSVSDEVAMDNFRSTVRFTDDRYQVNLPWKHEDVDLPDNFLVAKRRLYSLMKRLKRNPVLYAGYNDAVHEYVSSGVAETVSKENVEPVAGAGHPVYYLPHQAVIREDKTTTKLRIVFDASSHEPDVPSLNDLLHPGPNLNPDLLNLLIGFRKHKIAFVADIEKAFLQITISEADRDSVRFLWFDGLPDENDPSFSLRILRMTRVIFGVTSSPFLLAAVLKHHFESFKDVYPETTELLSDSMYVDDLIGGADNEEDAFRTSTEAKQILAKANMTLRKWQTNSEELMCKWMEADFDISTVISICSEKQTIPFKVLGLIWNQNEDIFRFDVSTLLEFLSSRKETKRSILQASGRLFDPFGFLTPFTIQIKKLFQRLWELGLGWDQELPEEVKTEWNSWCSELPALHKLVIPRYYFTKGRPKKEIQLHCFTDASEKAYGAVIFLRYITIEKTVTVEFLVSKARVAPLKKLSIPKLELTGAFLGAKLMNHVKTVFEGKAKLDLNYWTDSQVVLCWNKNSSNKWKPFVRNRVHDIQSLSAPENWSYCPGKENPADIITRGKQIAELQNMNSWWHGPKWLQEHETNWPKTTVPEMCIEAQCEERKTNIYHVLITEEPLLTLSRYSDLPKILRITAWVMRFLSRVKKNAEPSETLTAEEIRNARNYWIKDIQRTSFSKEQAALIAGEDIERTSKIVYLRPFLDEEGLMRVGGRLQCSSLNYNEKHPILLPDKSYFSKLLIKYCHERVGHSGVTHTLVQLRGEFWVIKARQLTKQVIQHCNLCKKMSARPATEVTAPLPSERIEEAPPFEITGVDFAGPLYVKTNEGTSKSYIALFTCAITRAVHLELVSNLTTEMFLLAFKRFVSRRGMCRVIYSDNGKTFKKAEKELKQLWKVSQDSEIKTYFGLQNITWRFIVERAAWWGGFYERLVRSVKNCLKKILGKALLTFEEMTTVLTQVEAIINSRPMTYTYDDAKEPSPLTPAHFLIGKRLTALPDARCSKTVPNTTKNQLQKRYKYQQLLINQFWKRWKDEYLLELRSAHFVTSKKQSKSVKVGDIVLLSEPRLPRLLWKMGKVDEVFHGRDGKVRSCIVRFPNLTTLRRPIQLLYPLEIGESVNNEK